MYNNVVYDSDDEGADLKCKEHLDLAVTADPSNAETFHTLASYWLCKGDRQVYHLWLLMCSLLVTNLCSKLNKLLEVNHLVKRYIMWCYWTESELLNSFVFS